MTEATERNPSRTALTTAWLRAAHQILDAPPRILDDTVALRLLGEAAEQRIREDAKRYGAAAALALRAHVVLRSRFAEDRLEEAVRRGVTQFVLLGAGLLKIYKHRAEIHSHEGVLLGVGFMTAFVSALLVVHPFMEFVKTRRLRVFAGYRVVLGIAVLSWWFFKC